MTTRRTAIPKSVKVHVWNLYIGDDKTEGKCYACGTRTIHITSFEAGHEKAVALGGKNNVKNLRPICVDCNKAMGTHSIEWYKAQFFGAAKAPEAAPSRRTRQIAPTAASAKCPNCKGKATLSARGFFDDSHPCPSCRKKGTVISTRAAWHKCRKCKGYGITGLFDERCPSCRGLGIVAPAS